MGTVMLLMAVLTGCKGELPKDPADLWEEKNILVYGSKGRGGVACPRLYTLQDGSLMCSFDANDDKGGYSVIKVVRSTDQGMTWSRDVVVSNTPDRICANGTIYQMKNGDILVAYRANIGADGVAETTPRHTAIKVSISRDNGETWEDHSTAIAYENNAGGVYEPWFVEINGVPTLFYANDSVDEYGKLGTGKNADGTHQAAVSNLDYQNIELIQLIDGEWKNRTVVCNGMNSDSRDGMPGVTQLADGRWMVAYEANNMRSKYPFVLRYKISEDGLTWDTSVANGRGELLHTPSVLGRKDSGPALVTLPNGRVFCGFQTDEAANKAGDAFQTMRVMVSLSDDPATFNTIDNWGEVYDVFETPPIYNSFWNGVAVHGDYAYAITSTNYPTNSIRLRRAHLSKFVEALDLD